MQQNSIAAILFIIITILTVYLFYRAANQSKLFLVIICTWALLQSIIAFKGFYINEFTKPPHFSLLLLPPVIFIVILLLVKKGRNFIDGLSIQQLTFLHAVRIFVEIVLYMLLISKTIPQVMTFEGRNFDIVAGITAPVVYYFVFIKRNFSVKFLIAWNILSLMLLLNIIMIAVLSLQTPLQKFGFDQPNIALTYFPFIWLPSVIVPIVLLSHVAALKQSFFSLRQNVINHSANIISLR